MLLDARPNEARLLLRQMYAALAEVEGVCIGDGGQGAKACAEMAKAIDQRLASLQAVLPLIEAMIAAVSEGDRREVESLLQQRPGLAYTVMEDELPAILFSQYRGRKDIVQALLASGMRLTMGEAAAAGEGERVRKIAKAWPGAVHDYTSDGFTPLQLACFFGHADIAAFLIDQGADIHAVAKNAMQIQPLHAAVAGQYAEHRQAADRARRRRQRAPAERLHAVDGGAAEQQQGDRGAAAGGGGGGVIMSRGRHANTALRPRDIVVMAESIPGRAGGGSLRPGC